jgi:hypothetical protein
MAWTLTSKNVEVASGVIVSMPFYYDGTNYYPAMQSVPGEAGGLSVYSFTAAASINATVIKATPGQVYGYSVSHMDATFVCLKWFDKATAPVPGTDTIKMRHLIPAIATTTLGAAFAEFWDQGIPFASGISIAVMANSGIADATATGSLTANEVYVNVYYK